MVALFDQGDRHHAACRRVMESIPGPLITVWPAVTEAAHHLKDVSVDAQIELLDLVQRGLFKIASLDREDIPRIRALMRRFADLPMDLADAALVHVAEREGIDTVFTIDVRDFSVYRPLHCKHFKLLP